MVQPTSAPAPEWELSLHREVLARREARSRLRILSPRLTDLPPGLVRAAAAAGSEPGTWGDRPAILGDPAALLAREDDLPAGFAAALRDLLERRRRLSWELPLPRGRRLRLGDPPAIFGVINVTPDSFSDGGLHLDPGRALAGALEMVEAGVDAIDVGGESTRPGAEAVEAAEERRRVEPVLRRIRAQTDVPISIDTTKADVARMALSEGADIINDVSALLQDPEMPSVAREARTPVVLMHRRGTPRDMQDDPRYDDVTREVYQFLARRVRELAAAGLDPERMVVDPGIGFGKRVEHNLALLRDVDELRGLGRPVLVGASRKTFMGRLLSAPGPAPAPPVARDAGTLAAHAAAIAGGAAAVRAHDVKLHRDLVVVLAAIARGARLEPRAG